jgi:hypothetical protein
MAVTVIWMRTKRECTCKFKRSYICNWVKKIVILTADFRREWSLLREMNGLVFDSGNKDWKE